MPKGYGQYCPLALATEHLCQRWTVLIVSRLIDGCVHFNEIHRGVPRISPSLLSKRIVELEQAGIIERRTVAGTSACEYHLTDAGQALAPIVNQLAIWGQAWARDLSTEDLDPAFLAWSMHTRLDSAAMPSGRTVLAFEFRGASSGCRRFWLVNDDGGVDMCLTDPGFDVDLHVSADLRRFVEAWRGFRDLRSEIRSGQIRLHGARELVKQFPKWLKLSALASYPRHMPGREKRLASRSK